MSPPALRGPPPTSLAPLGRIAPSLVLLTLLVVAACAQSPEGSPEPPSSGTRSEAAPDPAKTTPPAPVVIDPPAPPQPHPLAPESLPNKPETIPEEMPPTEKPRQPH
jgi:hypothetical protein